MEMERLNELLEVQEAEEAQEIQETASDYDMVKEVDAAVYTGIEGIEEEVVIITGSPFEVAENLDYEQGDNSYEALGCCGLVSCANFLAICGIETSEEEIVGLAVENGLCNYSPWLPPENRGGTNDYDLETILEHYGIECSVYYPYEGDGSLEGIAAAIENGQAVMMGVNAGYLWDDPVYINDGSANHQITITGSVRDANGELIGLTICDSGRHLQGDSCRFISAEEFEACYTTVPGASVIISDGPVR